MSRKSEIVQVPAWGGRDAGKLFRITEMAAGPAEKWALRFALALKGTTASIPESLAPYGMVAIAIRGINSFLASDVDFAKLEPLLDEMFECVQIIRDKAHPETASAIVSDDDIEEVKTRGWLRSEVLRIHTNFSFDEALSSWWAISKSQAEASPST
jgi:hypothetical protein